MENSLILARAHWVTAGTIAWNVRPDEGFNFMLHFAPQGGLVVTEDGVQGGEIIPLHLNPQGLPKPVRQKFPHLQHYAALQMSQFERVPEMLRGQVAVSVVDADGNFVDATSLQIPGVVDDLFYYDGPLGIEFQNGIPTIRVWSPLARTIRLHLFDESGISQPRDEFEPHADFPMDYDPHTGVWSITGEADWQYKYYLFEVDVFVRWSQKFERNFVTDPYSVSLSMNSIRSQMVDLNDPALMPEGWLDYPKPRRDDMVIYELHVRDFSIADTSVSKENRGKFCAFTELDSYGMQHLRALAEAGLTHVHLLPTFDIASIEEDFRSHLSLDFDALRTYPPDSAMQQELVSEIRHNDGYNWGYDPYHFNVPEGSYATNPDGPTRILEFRKMVMALNSIGLKVVTDMVYNHTRESGQHPQSVFDRIVPGYYHRYNGDGWIESSTCCSNTASEHHMMENFMLDSVYLWATAYRVDGFRFDLMGHHMKENMVKIRHMLDRLPDGKNIYLYGEGWDFGEVAWGRLGINANQFNMAGTGIGTFNDRLRDAVRGGDHSGHPRVQGFVNGLYHQPNHVTPGRKKEQRQWLLHHADEIRVGLAGNLRDYKLVNMWGDVVTGWEIPHEGAPTGYNLHPRENVVYVGAHDNETLFDTIQYKASGSATLDERVRMHNLALSICIFSQGVPFLHAGDDLLRSKSLDRDSYNSGDWFNHIDWSCETNNWGIGLPIADKNQHHWELQKSLLANPALKPTKAHLLRAVNHTREMLYIRKTTPLLRLKTAQEVKKLVKFYNVGLDQMPGVIVMSMADEVLVIFNAVNKQIAFTDDTLGGYDWQLHPVLATSYDPIVRKTRSIGGTFTVPARTTAVFVR